MKNSFCPESNFNETRRRLGYTKRRQTPSDVYEKLGFMCGLEVHQQLMTQKKLFCNCPAGIYQKKGQYDAEVIRHMRPTLSEMGGYDGTALMEFKTKKTIIYRISNITTCTYDVDDTPPFKINHEALKIALEIALLLKTNIVGELHITRKQYLDGSIPTGFQRTGIISIEGQIPLKNKNVRIIQLSLEEDSCREVSDLGHTRVYTTDRLGMPLIETVTYPDMKTPEEAAEAAQYIRFLNRSSSKVRTGIGATREDVNVSITGGTRVEIKGVAHISLIPELVHNEAFRQKSLLEIKKELLSRNSDIETFVISHCIIDCVHKLKITEQLKDAIDKGYKLVGINIPNFQGILSFFTQPGRMFVDEISDRLKVIACIEKPNMIHSESIDYENNLENWNFIKNQLKSSPRDAQLLIWGPDEDIKTALETIEERCLMCFKGVPNETRKSLLNGTTIFERVLPGADRMYPDTDSAPISISEELIDNIRESLPVDVDIRISQLRSWRVPEDSFSYLLRYNLVPLIERIVTAFKVDPKYVSTLLAHRLKHLQGKLEPDSAFSFERIFELFEFIKAQNLHHELAYEMLPILYRHPRMEMESILEKIEFSRCDYDDIASLVPFLKEKFNKIKTSRRADACYHWMMKEIRKTAIGNIPLNKIAELIMEGAKSYE